MSKTFNIIIFFAALSFAVYAIYFHPDHKPSDGAIYFLCSVSSIFIFIIFGILIFSNKGTAKDKK